MIGTDAEVGEQQLFTARMLAATVRLHGYEYRVDVCKRLCFTGLEHPTLLPEIVFVEHAEVERLLLVRSAAPPSLKGAGVLNSGLRIQIIGVEDQPLALGVKNPAIGFGRLPITGDVVYFGNIDVVYFGNIKVAGAHQFSDVAIMLEKVLILGHFCFRKSQVLSNLHRVLARDDRTLVLVEGFFDTFKLHQAGLRNVAALMGSRLSDGQAKLILQHFDRIILMLDGDEAGRAGTTAAVAALSPFLAVDTVKLALGAQPDQLAPEEILRILAGFAQNLLTPDR